MPAMDHEDGAGLGNRTLIDKVDKLRELGVSETIPLPQIVVAGEQSAGKSSLLESLTRISFPRSVSLCTRFATEIICRRERDVSITVTIQPGPASPAAHVEKIRAFRRTVNSFTGESFSTIFKEAATAMGIKSDPKEMSDAPTFTKDVLRIEKSGPEEAHLTLIDVPGIFENESPGITTARDIIMVKEMVRSYIKDSRTIILAVVPCNTDIATQSIIRFASQVDPEGKRTLGVLTKPDLAVETATKNAVADLVRGRRRDLQLGYCIVRNRGADDHSAEIDSEARDAQERDFFSHEPWSALDPSRVGIPALGARLRELLMDRTKSEFASVKRELLAKLKEAKQQLADMGPSRIGADEQRAFLGAVATRFSKLVGYGLDAYYTGDPIFVQREDLRLITRVRVVNEAFSKIFYEKAHSMEFQEKANAKSQAKEQKVDDEVNRGEENPDSELGVGPSTYLVSFSTPMDRGSLYPIGFEIPTDGQEDLDGILADPFMCTSPSGQSLTEEIGNMYKSYRGYELGTFGSWMIPTTFRLQAAKWEAAALAHVSNAVLIVHHFIRALVEETCPEEAVRSELWSFLLNELTNRYRSAMDHARFLLAVELKGQAVTCNPQFDNWVRNNQKARFSGDLKNMAVAVPDQVRGVREGLYVHLDDLSHGGNDDGGVGVGGAMCGKIHDVMKSYYEVARSRFVDNICVQAVDHFLLSGEDSPLRVFNNNLVLSMTESQLDIMAGEDALSRNQRITLNNRIDILEKAVKVLRG